MIPQTIGYLGLVIFLNTLYTPKNIRKYSTKVSKAANKTNVHKFSEFRKKLQDTSAYQYNLAIQDIYFIFLRANKRAETNMQLAIITPHFMTSIPGYTWSMQVIIMI